MQEAYEINIKAVNRGDKRTRRVRDQVSVKFETSRRYRDRYRCQEKKSRRGRARNPVFRDPTQAENENFCFLSLYEKKNYLSKSARNK